jgi:ABC-type sugar transport system ATPase subunit
MVFQSYALYPHMSVYGNLAFSLKIAGIPKAERDARVRKAADMLRLTPYLDRRPRELSGGQRQRVAIGRAIVRDAKVFLFDEPLSNLDAALRVATRVEIAKLKETLADTTMVYVTHDQVEAMTLADRIVVLNAGHIEQVGRPVDLYLSPRNAFVAGFIGSPAMNFLPCDLEETEGGVRPRLSDGSFVPVRYRRTGCGGAAGARGTVGIRPEALKPTGDGDGLIVGAVDLVENLGDTTIVYVTLSRGEPILVKLEGIVEMAKGTTIRLAAPPDAIHCFDGSGTALQRLPA